MDFECFISPDAVTVNDGLQARYVDLDPDPDATSGLWVTLRSWAGNAPYAHPEFEALVGRRVRVRIEPID